MNVCSRCEVAAVHARGLCTKCYRKAYFSGKITKFPRIYQDKTGERKLVKENKSAHRKIIFGDHPDVMF